MQEEVILLISLLKEQLVNLQEEIKKEETKGDTIIDENRELIKSLKKDKNSILNIDLLTIKEILSELKVDNPQEILKYMEVIQKLLRLNKEEHTTYKITESQLEVINSFLKKIEEYEKRQKKSYDKKIESRKDYQLLLDKLIQNKEPITEMNIMKRLFKDLSIKEETQSKILIGLMKYNKEKYSKDSSNLEILDW